uniref:Organic solute transporter alpha-like protein n=1 Tax=Ascaris suum TaxID=6253 RepID=F1L915_ASCSU
MSAAELFSSLVKHSLNYTPMAPPDVNSWITEMSSPYVVLLSMSTAFTVIVFVLCVFHLYFVFKYISNERVQTDLYWIVLMCPVATLCGLVGMFIPRSASFMYSVALVYFMLCLFVIVTLMKNMFGSRAALSEYLLSKGLKISFQVPPICCFCHCLPTIEGKKRNLRCLEWIVFQSPIVRIVLETTNIIVFLELNSRTHLWFQISNAMGLISMIIAFYACYVIIPLGHEKLEIYRFSVIFRLVDTAQAIYSIQKFVFDLAAAVGIFADGILLPGSSKAQFWMSFMLTWEMALISMLATFLLRPSQNTALFDKYDRLRPNASTESIAVATPSVANNTSQEHRVPERPFDRI